MIKPLAQVLMAAACLLMMVAADVFAGEPDENGFVRITPEQLDWQDLRPGLSFAILEGDPSSEGFYIIRARFAPGTFSRPHFHPRDRFITVIEGTWWTGTGAVMDKTSAIPLKPGAYMKHPAGAPHYDGAKAQSVIVEIKGMGPAPLIYVDEQERPLE